LAVLQEFLPRTNEVKKEMKRIGLDLIGTRTHNIPPVVCSLRFI
jgi:hypothetical protein